MALPQLKEEIAICGSWLRKKPAFMRSIFITIDRPRPKVSPDLSHVKYCTCVHQSRKSTCYSSLFTPSLSIPLDNQEDLCKPEMKLFVPLLCCCFSTVPLGTSAQSTVSPNIVFFLADDLGTYCAL